MITLLPLRNLTLTKPSDENRDAHLSAASGLVQVGNWLYVVADDENHLGVFLCNSTENGYLKKLFHGDLPLEYEARKAAKPDLEVLTLIPAGDEYTHGALLALGSGSKDIRKKGVIVSLNQFGEPHDDVKIIDLEKLYKDLKKEIGKLNIEGAVIIADDIILFQRSNKKNNINVTIRFSLKHFFKYISSENTEQKYKLDIKITHYTLGEIEGTPLCFTDATSLADGTIIFTAAAENTSDSYLDGACMGSIIGIIKPNGELHSLNKIDKTLKLEGIEANTIDNKIHLLLVTDADNAVIPAQLYSAILDI